jgi:hypothetical protein
LGFESRHANLRRAALLAKRSTVLDRRSTFVTGMLHRNSR